MAPKKGLVNYFALVWGKSGVIRIEKRCIIDGHTVELDDGLLGRRNTGNTMGDGWILVGVSAEWCKLQEREAINRKSLNKK